MTTRADLRQRIGSGAFLGDTLVSTATGGTSTTLVDTKQAQDADVWNGSELVHKPGASGYEVRRVTDFASGGTFTADRAFTATPVNADNYEVHRVFSPGRKNDAINEAIRISGKRFARRTQDTSLTTAANKYGYNITSLSPAVDRDWGLIKVEYDTGLSGTNVPYQEVDNDYWEVVDDNATLMLQFSGIVFDTNTRTLRLTYLVRPSVFSNDTGALDPRLPNFENFICTYATGTLARARWIAEGGEPGSGWHQVYQRMQRELDSLDTDRPRRKASSVKLPVYGEDRSYVEPAVGRIRIP